MADTQRRSWSRHCATNRKVVGLILTVIGIFHWHNPSSRTMALGSIQPLTEISTRNISWGRKGSWCMGLTTLPPSYAERLDIREAQPPGTHRACPGLYRDCFTLTFYIIYIYIYIYIYIWWNMIVVHIKSLEQFACLHIWHIYSANCKTSHDFNTILTYLIYV